MDGIFIDGDFPTGKKCKHHCSPTCHPGQVDENHWHYGCLHNAWPQNKDGDFCPFVECDGDPAKCEIPKKFIKSMIAGKKRKITNAKRKIETTEKEIKELEEFLTTGSTCIAPQCRLSKCYLASPFTSCTQCATMKNATSN